MANETTTQIVQENPRVEAYRLGLLQDVKDLVGSRMGEESLPPAYQVAGLTGLEAQASALGGEGIGSYVPYLQGGLNQVIGAQDSLQALIP